VAAASVLLVATLAAIGAASVSSPSPPSRPSPVAATGLPRPVTPAFTPGPPRPLGSSRNISHWAALRKAVSARSAPSAAAPAVAALGLQTPEGTQNTVAVLGRAQDRAGRPWVHVALPVLPNGTTGWVPRRALGGYESVYTLLDVDLERLRATLYANGRRVLAAAIAVGMPGWETPRGRFYIRNKLTRYESPAYGPVAFGTSARSPVATGWPAGGFIGIHGTNRPALVPGRVSHGCIRMRNADILALARRMPIGTPVRIH
jgi:lipoprotein-anchoring transpeptidase ErfK/SrfK